VIVVDRAIAARQRGGRPVVVGMYGSGFMARGALINIERHMKVLRIAAICNRNVERAIAALLDAGVAREDIEAVESAAAMDRALAAGRRAVTADPKLYEPNQKLVALLIATARPAEAVEVARAYLAARPEDLRANHLVADAHLAAGAYSEADAVLSAVLADDDSDSMALETRARARILAGDLARGEEDYRRALEIDAENPEYMVGLGSVLIRRGEKAEAKEWLGKVLAKRIVPELDPSAKPDLRHDSSTNALIRRFRTRLGLSR